MHPSKPLRAIAPLLVIWLAFAPTARADFLVTMNNVYNGASPSGTGPFGTALFQTVATGTVRLTMQNDLNASTEFIRAWYFNFDPAFNANTLSFSLSSGQAAQSIGAGVNSVEPPGQGGDFDIAFRFETANNANRFTPGESSVYTITGAGITAESFRYFSVNENNSFLSVIQVQGIPAGGGRTTSGDVAGEVIPQGNAVPEPASLTLLALGSAGLVYARRRVRPTR